jgi:hypothetical protein
MPVPDDLARSALTGAQINADYWLEALRRTKRRSGLPARALRDRRREQIGHTTGVGHQASILGEHVAGSI